MTFKLFCLGLVTFTEEGQSSKCLVLSLFTLALNNIYMYPALYSKQNSYSVNTYLCLSDLSGIIPPKRTEGHRYAVKSPTECHTPCINN